MANERRTVPNGDGVGEVLKAEEALREVDGKDRHEVEGSRRRIES